MSKPFLKRTAPTIAGFLAAGALILIPVKVGAVDLKSFFTHSHNDNVKMCKADNKAIYQELRHYVTSSGQSSAKIKGQLQQLADGENEVLLLCEQKTLAAMRVNEKNWGVVESLRKKKAKKLEI